MGNTQCESGIGRSGAAPELIGNRSDRALFGAWGRELGILARDLHRETAMAGRDGAGSFALSGLNKAFSDSIADLACGYWYATLSLALQASGHIGPFDGFRP